MQNILKSASKLVFVLMALGALIGFFMGRLSEGNFMILCGGAFTFYFAAKGETGKRDGGGAPFGGK